MEIIKQQNCKFSTKDIVLIVTVVGAVIVASICKKEDEIYE